MKCTFKELTLENGEVIKLTLNFARLLQLKNKRKKEYEEYYVVDIVNSPRMGVCDYIGARDIYSL